MSYRYNSQAAFKEAFTFLLIFCLLGIPGCSQDPQKAKKKYFESAQKY